MVGIDLGTTNSLLALASGGQPALVTDADGAPVAFPSAVSYAGDSVLVGRAALERAPLAPEATILSVKRLMGQSLAELSPAVQRHFSVNLVEGGSEGRSHVEIEIEGKRRTPQEVSAQILAELKRRAEAGLGHPVTKAVVTVPAYFDDAQRQATRDAGKMAGLEVLRIINEPTAASLAYGLGGKEAEGVIAVYDLGGGTFDLSLLRVQAGTFRVLATAGDTHLGGDDVDGILVESALAALAAQGLSSEAVESPRLRAQLRAAAEAAKIELSASEQATLRVKDPTHGVNLELVLTRAELEKAIESLVARTLELCQGAMTSAGLTPDQIDEVVLVGGSTRVPYVRQRVGEFFGREPHTELDPDKVVALGASIQAEILSGKNAADLLLLDVTPLSLGLETFGGGVNKLIMANSGIPTQASVEFTTPQDNVTAISLHVLQGERELVETCRSLAHFKLKIPPMPAGMPKVKVTFLIDADGILRVMASEERSGAETEIEVTPVHGLTDEEVDEIMEESFQHAIADVNLHQLIDLRNESATVIRAASKALTMAGDGLTAAQREPIEAGITALEALCKGDVNAEIKASLEALNDACEPLAELVLDRAVNAALGGKALTELEDAVEHAIQSTVDKGGR
ncbi:MAG: Fe-S protein assembly chaperone HscA [Planctomycetes bacterium]|nr:Fe-S protein assembly chaperone HscA [Planctomycetota bacterium]